MESSQQIRVDDETLVPPHVETIPITRSILGALAVFKRRVALDEMDKIWDSLDLASIETNHPYPEMKAAITTPGLYVGDRSLLIYRTAEQYRRVPTKAQAASLRWLWPIHTCTYIANFRNFLATLDQTPEIIFAKQRLIALQKQQTADVPDQMQQEGDIEPAVRSILARLFVLMRG